MSWRLALLCCFLLFLEILGDKERKREGNEEETFTWVQNFNCSE
jgi:hypothetical protein